MLVLLVWVPTCFPRRRWCGLCSSSQNITSCSVLPITYSIAWFAKLKKKTKALLLPLLAGFGFFVPEFSTHLFSPATACGTTWETPAYCQKNRCMGQFIVACCLRGVGVYIAGSTGTHIRMGTQSRSLSPHLVLPQLRLVSQQHNGRVSRFSIRDGPL